MSGHRHDMTDAAWAILRSVLPPTHQGPRRLQDRRVMDGIFVVLRTGIPWRDLPERTGPDSTGFNRDNRWSQNGTWARIMPALAERADDDPEHCRAATLRGAGLHRFRRIHSQYGCGETLCKETADALVTTGRPPHASDPDTNSRWHPA